MEGLNWIWYMYITSSSKLFYKTLEFLVGIRFGGAHLVLERDCRMASGAGRRYLRLSGISWIRFTLCWRNTTWEALSLLRLPVRIRIVLKCLYKICLNENRRLKQCSLHFLNCFFSVIDITYCLNIRRKKVANCLETFYVNLTINWIL